MRIYIAGPMRGKPDLNLVEFTEAALWYREQGCEVLNPHEIAEQQKVGAECNRAHCLIDIAALVLADAIALLPGWENSVGAAAELACAKWMLIPILYYKRPSDDTQAVSPAGKRVWELFFAERNR